MSWQWIWTGRRGAEPKGDTDLAASLAAGDQNEIY